MQVSWKSLLQTLVCFTQFKLNQKYFVPENSVKRNRTMSSSAAASSTSTQKVVTCTRLPAVRGHSERANDVIFCGSKHIKPEKNVVVFGGDAQDYKEIMLAHPHNKMYEMWDLETTAKIIQARFPTSHVWVVKPKQMYMKMCSIFSNFVQFDEIGVPTHNTHYNSWLHLSKLLVSASRQVNNIISASGTKPNQSAEKNKNDDTETYLTTPNIPISLIGFSKGCVVLNQFMYELESAKQNPELQGFIKRVSHLYFLDGGHIGSSKVWITDLSVLKSLVNMDIEIRCHVTPYQVNDLTRAWIGQEHKKFVHSLRKLNVTVYDTLHFAHEERSLQRHFEILTRF